MGFFSKELILVGRTHNKAYGTGSEEVIINATLFRPGATQ
jgi:hypothetical protein